MLMTLTPVVMFIVTAILNVTAEKSTTLLSGWLLRLGRQLLARDRGAAATRVPTLDEVTAAMAAQGTDLRAFTVEALLRYGYQRAQAEKVADDLVAAFGALLSATPEDPDVVDRDPGR